MNKKTAKKKPTVLRRSKERPSTYRMWVLWRMRKRQLRGADIVGCSHRVLMRPPKYLGFDVSTDDKMHAANTFVRAELTKMRDEGLITCTDGWWWRRRPTLRAVP